MSRLYDLKAVNEIPASDAIEAQVLPEGTSFIGHEPGRQMLVSAMRLVPFGKRPLMFKSAPVETP